MKTYKVEQLRQAVNEVDDLRHEEHEQRFAEVAENGDNCQRHSAETKKNLMNKREAEKRVQLREVKFGSNFWPS